jgi:hypothetical protein
MVKPTKHNGPRATVGYAESLIAELQEKQRACVERGTALQDERKAIALGAHTGNVDARLRLNDINVAIATHDSELASLAAALAEAANRLAQARQAETAAADREAAKALLAQLKRFRDFARSTDDALSVLVDSTVGMQNALRAMHIAGSSFPSDAQLLSLGGRVMLAALSRTPFRRNFVTLPPHERSRTMTAIVEQWAATVERAISQRLGEQSNNEAA